MWRRRLAFAVAVALASALYAALFHFAPRIEILHARARSERIHAPLRVRLAPERPAPPPPRAEEVPASRPGAVRDLLRVDPVPLALPPPLALAASAAPAAPADVRGVPLPEASIDPEALRRADARIAELALEAARRNVQVARRIVRPSPERLLDEGATPALRTPAAGDPPAPLPGGIAPVSLLAGAAPGLPLARADLPAPPMAGAALGTGGAPALPAPGSEAVIARGPAEQGAAAARAARGAAFWDDLVDIAIDTHIDPAEPLGYFRVRMTPRKGAEIAPLPKDVVFVVDASQSIPQHKLNATAKGLRKAIAALGPEDRFNVVAFRDAPQPFRPDLVPADDAARAAAGEFLGGLETGGHTDLYAALDPLLATPRRPGLPGLLVVASDGRPTAGVQDSRAIIHGITVDNANGHTIVAFGGGNTVNRYLLELLAEQNRGAAEVAGEIGQIEAGLPAFAGQFAEPLLADIEARFGRIDTVETYPRRLPDFYRGRPLTLYGRFDPAANDDFTLHLAGRAGALRKEMIFRANLREAPAGGDAVAREWAFRKAYDLAGRIAAEGETPERTAALESLRAKYGVRTSYSE